MLATKLGVSPKEQLAGFQNTILRGRGQTADEVARAALFLCPNQSGTIVGTIFGGSMYSAVDPIYMVMLIRRLGKDYVVWDKAASIQFKKPGRETLHARFVVTDGELAAIRAALETQRSIDRTYLIELKDSSGTVCATVERLIYIRKR
jgi:hypothetical protein